MASVVTGAAKARRARRESTTRDNSKSTTRPGMPGVDSARASEALERAVGYLLELQSEAGWWKGELETNVTMDAEDLLLREFLGIRDPKDTAAKAAWIREHQREDGTWANFYGGPADLSTTTEAYVALRLAGDQPSAEHMARAAEFIRSRGGVEATRVFTRLWLALFGWWSWDDLPIMPPELMLLPSSVPLSIYDFGCWARQTVVALTIVGSSRPVHRAPFLIDEIRSGKHPEMPRPGLADWKQRFVLLDKVLKVYDRVASGGLLRATVREHALRRAEQWLIQRQEADGGWGGIQPPWVYSLIALHERGYPLDHPVMATALRGLESFTVTREDGVRWLEACQSPVWDTALAVVALRDAGLAGDDERLLRAGRWLLGEEVRRRGDWAVRRPHVPAGGWAFEFANDNYPDLDDTAEVVMALRRLDPPDASMRAEIDAAVGRAIAWSQGMASRDGAWGAFDADNLRQLLYELPFCDFGAVIDPPSADVTAHVIEMLAGEAASDPDSMAKGIAWLRRAQEPDGSWFGRWGVNYLYGIGAALPALAAVGIPPSDQAMRAAVEFLVRHQNEDGGWGEDIRSYDDPSSRAVGASTASQTAWALLALVAAGEASSPAARRGVAYLAQTQRPDGTWDEPYYTGTGFPGDFYINYHLYRLIFPVAALGRWCEAIGAEESAPGEEAS